MAYATQEEIEGDFKNVTFTTATSVTTADVARFIDEASALIDAKVGMVYTVPVTGPNALLVLKTICIDLVCPRIKRILDVKTGAEETEQGVKGTVEGAAMRRLNDIVARKLLLSDAVSLEAGEGVSSYAVNNSLEHTFKKGERQW
jgi:hypothetical protein